MTDALMVRSVTGTREETALKQTYPIPVYFAGPIDYIEHRSPGDHLRDNWRHRFFGDIEDIELLCPTCINQPVVVDTDREAARNMAPLFVERIMANNATAIRRARHLVAYFPADVASFGTPVEIYEWATSAFRRSVDPGVLVHPARPGVVVRWLQERHDLHVVPNFEAARSWLLRQL